MSLIKQVTPEGELIQGTPAEVVIELSKKIIAALEAANIQPNGINIIALIHVAAGVWRTELANPNPEMGVMPSFASMLSTLTRTATNSHWTEAETKAFDDEFCVIVESLGGSKLPPSTDTVSGVTKDGRLIMSPSLGVH